jgi:hypothetical protein
LPLNNRVIRNKALPDCFITDIILVDLGDGTPEHFLLVFVEVVATDGPVTLQRQEALLNIAEEAGFSGKRTAFVTAYLDRSHAAFKRTVPELAWGSFAWFAAEPENIIVLHDGAASALPLAALVGR